MAEPRPGPEALEFVARVLEQRPFKDDHALSAATHRLAAFREVLIDAQRKTDATDGHRERLARLNAIIGVVMGMHFPLGKAPWGEFEKAQVWLRDLVAETER